MIPNYLKKLDALIAAGGIPLIPGADVRVLVVHDGWCPALHGGTCSCDCDLVIDGIDTRVTFGSN